mmetsp:Transcript_76533/g.242010  ORF Transcript_76533/g.242010 Transcript_76533/m.242010 type:complete len:463 (-) Transcript_76533:790-2178(-)
MPRAPHEGLQRARHVLHGIGHAGVVEVLALEPAGGGAEEVCTARITVARHDARRRSAPRLKVRGLSPLPKILLRPRLPRAGAGEAVLLRGVAPSMGTVRNPRHPRQVLADQRPVLVEPASGSLRYFGQESPHLLQHRRLVLLHLTVGLKVPRVALRQQRGGQVEVREDMDGLDHALLAEDRRQLRQASFRPPTGPRLVALQDPALLVAPLRQGKSPVLLRPGADDLLDVQDLLAAFAEDRLAGDALHGLQTLLVGLPAAHELVHRPRHPEGLDGVEELRRGRHRHHDRGLLQTLFVGEHVEARTAGNDQAHPVIIGRRLPGQDRLALPRELENVVLALGGPLLTDRHIVHCAPPLNADSFALRGGPPGPQGFGGGERLLRHEALGHDVGSGLQHLRGTLEPLHPDRRVEVQAPCVQVHAVPHAALEEDLHPARYVCARQDDGPHGEVARDARARNRHEVERA